MKKYDLAVEIEEELRRARTKFPDFHSAHEGLAVLWEEFEELKAEVFKNRATFPKGAIRKEAIQVAAMAIRFIEDVCDGLGTVESQAVPWSGREMATSTRGRAVRSAPLGPGLRPKSL